MSYTEELCYESLVMILASGTALIRNYRPDFLKNPETGRNLEYDFYLPDLKLAIEIQGPSHFDDPAVIARDKLKSVLTELAGVHVVYLTPTQIAPASLYKRLIKVSRLFSWVRPDWLRPFDPKWLEDTRTKAYKQIPFQKHACQIPHHTHQRMSEKKVILDQLSGVTYVKAVSANTEEVGRVLQTTRTKVQLSVGGKPKWFNLNQLRFL